MISFNTTENGTDEISSRGSDQTGMSRTGRLWSRFLDWMTDPIPFPGEWPVIDSQQDGYNKNIDVHESRAAEPLERGTRGAALSDLKNSTELLDIIGKILLRCALFGFLLLFVWFAVYIAAPIALRGRLFDLTPHEVDLIHYCGIGFTKVLVLLFFVFPYISIRLVLRRQNS